MGSVDEGVEVRPPWRLVCPDCEARMWKARERRADGSWAVVWICKCLETEGLPVYAAVGRQQQQDWALRLTCAEVPPLLRVSGRVDIWFTGPSRLLPEGCLVEVDVMPGLRAGLRPAFVVDEIENVRWGESGWGEADEEEVSSGG